MCSLLVVVCVLFIEFCLSVVVYLLRFVGCWVLFFMLLADGCLSCGVH